MKRFSLVIAAAVVVLLYNSAAFAQASSQAGQTRGGGNQPGTSDGNSADMSAAGTGESYSEKMDHSTRHDANNPRVWQELDDEVHENPDQQDASADSHSHQDVAQNTTDYGTGSGRNGQRNNGRYEGGN